MCCAVIRVVIGIHVLLLPHSLLSTLCPNSHTVLVHPTLSRCHSFHMFFTVFSRHLRCGIYIFNDGLVQMCEDQGSPGAHPIRCIFAMPALLGSKPVSTSHVPVPHGHEVDHTHCPPGVREAGLEQRSSGAFHCRSVCPLSFGCMPIRHCHEVSEGSRRSQRSASRKRTQDLDRK